MRQPTLPNRSDGSRLSALPCWRYNSVKQEHRSSRHKSKVPIKTTTNNFFLTSSISEDRDFSALPFDLLTKIAASFTLPDLQAASLVCRSWRDALCPLREAMVLLRWGKRFKHGKGGVRPNTEKALESFLKGAARGSTLAMVDAGLMYWESGKREEAAALYRRAAELGDPAGQCNLGISYLQGQPPNPKEAIKWLYLASVAGHVRAQYQLALCLHQGSGVDLNLQEAARWYLKAAEGGYTRAMYNIALCYEVGEGLGRSHRLARKWMKRAADRGHTKAQFEHGLCLFSEGELMTAVVYLELASRGGESAAVNVENIILQQLSAASRDRAMFLADSWHALPSCR
ncbi:F-box protein [Tripterygium wilfordii]|uniref:F-box protein n=1 Tax=Tripterygium wilfordii TaxID=458696 RepID=A0A7J7DJT1_TRIWF|nr:F-box protein At1g70590 [Tripterygium wilfordii]KAF5746568.1 F-box protein [Tripterygium wilfordii]